MPLRLDMGMIKEAISRALAESEQRRRELAILERQSQLQSQQLQQKMLMDMLTGEPRRKLEAERLELSRQRSESEQALSGQRLGLEQEKFGALQERYGTLEERLKAATEQGQAKSALDLLKEITSQFPPETPEDLAALENIVQQRVRGGGPMEFTRTGIETTPGRFEPITLPGMTIPEGIGEGLRPPTEPLGGVQRRLRAAAPIEEPQPVQVEAERYVPPVTKEVRKPIKFTTKPLIASERQATLAEAKATAAREWAAELGLSPGIAKNITDVDEVAKVIDTLKPEQIQVIAERLSSEPDIDPAVQAAIVSGNPALIKTALVQGITAATQAKQTLFSSRLIEERSKRGEKRAEEAPPSRREMEKDLQKARKDLFEAQENVVDKETFSRAFPAKAAELQPRVDAAKKVRDEYQKIVNELEAKLGRGRKSVKPKLLPPLKSGATRQSRAKQLETAGYKAQEILDILKKEIAAGKYK